MINNNIEHVSSSHKTYLIDYTRTPSIFAFSMHQSFRKITLEKCTVTHLIKITY